MTHIILNAWRNLNIRRLMVTMFDLHFTLTTNRYVASIYRETADFLIKMYLSSVPCLVVGG